MRKAKPKKRILLPDPKFSDVAVTRFVNNLMLDGKKSIAYTIFYDSLELVGKKMKDADNLRWKSGNMLSRISRPKSKLSRSVSVARHSRFLWRFDRSARFRFL